MSNMKHDLTDFCMFVQLLEDFRIVVSFMLNETCGTIKTKNTHFITNISAKRDLILLIISYPNILSFFPKKKNK